MLELKSLAPTVKATGLLPGDLVHASVFSFPAAAIVKIPAA